MNITTTLNSLENSWERDIILTKIKNGLSIEEIVNEFLSNNNVQVKELNNLLRPHCCYRSNTIDFPYWIEC